MDQYTNYLDALSQSMYSQQPNGTSTSLSSESRPPSLSASPVSSEGSDSFIDEVIQYGLFSYDPSSAPAYNSYSQNSFNNLVAGSMSMTDHSSSTPVVKQADLFGYDAHMAFDRGIAPSLTGYQPLTGYTVTQECNPVAFDYPVHANTATTLANMLAHSAPFATVAPSATSALTDEDTSAYNLSAGIAELSISSPASSPIYHAGSMSSSPTLVPILQPPPTPSCDPKALGSPILMEQPIIQSGPSSQAEGSVRARSSSYRASAVDSDYDYSPSGESEIEDENDHSYGEPPNKKKARSARVSHAAHPYLKPPKAKNSKRRGTKLEIPVPVPGLTKNSRGRCVPKKTERAYDDGSRPFWCNVEDCDKLFNRGEHLKRHILSIHTEKKPFLCECGNGFSRRDNLFQHMRAKGCVIWYKDEVRQPGPNSEVRQPGPKSEVDYLKAKEDAMDRHIQRIMADAKIAQNKRDRYCKQARSQF